MNTRSLARFLIILICASLISCGFQLRGVGDLALDQIYVDDLIDIQQAVDQPVIQQLIADLDAITEVSRVPVSAPGILILNEEYRERTLSISTNLFNRQIELEKRVYYRIVDAQAETLVDNSVVATRELTEDQANPSAKDQERKILTDAINKDISRELIQHLSNVLKSET